MQLRAGTGRTGNRVTQEPQDPGGVAWKPGSTLTLPPGCECVRWHLPEEA